MRHAIAILFLLLLSSQVLPLKQVGKILFKSQITEEIHNEGGEHANDDDAVKLFTHSGHPPYTPESIKFLTAVIAVHIHIVEMIPDYHLPEILTPPPNRC